MQRRILELDPDDVITAVFLLGGRVAHVVLLAQLVRDAGRGGVEIPAGAHNLCPVCAIGTASASASYIAVPPPAVMRPTTRLRRLRSVVQSCSSSGKLLKR